MEKLILQLSCYELTVPYSLIKLTQNGTALKKLAFDKKTTYFGSACNVRLTIEAR